VPDLLRRHNVDLLAIHWMTYDAERLIRHAKSAGIPFVIANHFDNGLFSNPRMRKWLPHAAAVGAVSPKGIPTHVASRCVNLLDGIDTEFFAPEKARPLPALDRPLILLPALVKESKGQYDLLQAARILASRNVDFDIRFAGAVESDSLYRRLHEYASANGLADRIAFLGEIDQMKIRDWYAASTVVVLPTHWEGLGRCLAEAQAMEKPVVAYDSGGVAETVLPNETGLLVKTGDVEALADKIDFLLANQTERQRMAQRGREFVVQKFSLMALIDRHERFYFKALQR
jgi:glycosyltransferase involved in cell wall biosynthesis